MLNSVKEAVYRHLVVEGTSYEVGKKEGEFIKKYHPEDLEFFTHGNEFIKPAAKQQIEKTIELFDKYCPYLNEEIKGFAESIGVSAESIIYYSFSNVYRGNCGHFAVRPDKMLDNHFYVGRSYEWSDEDELRLLTTKVRGLNAHIGFSLLLFGRFDGINEQGLCVTMSNAVPCVLSDEEGLRFWVVIRILLDKCKTVDEAIKLINELPISSHCNLIVADRNNNAVLAEISNSTKTYKKISAETTDYFLCSTNHYTLDGMEGFVKNRMKHSVDRYNAITRNLHGKDEVDKAELTNILSRHIPEGLACHYYEDGLGTLWSILFDITEIKAEICFGSPVRNKWYTFNLDSGSGVTEYRVEMPFESADPETWKHI